jgi:hypothetical protein
VSYAPSATVFKYLWEQRRTDRNVGLLALVDPVFDRPHKSSEPKPVPDPSSVARTLQATD